MIIDPTAKSQEAMTAKTLVVPPAERSGEGPAVAAKTPFITVTVGDGEGSETLPLPGENMRYTEGIAIKIANSDAIVDMEAEDRAVAVLDLVYADVPATYGSLSCNIRKTAVDTYVFTAFAARSTNFIILASGTFLKGVGDVYTLQSMIVFNVNYGDPKYITAKINSTNPALYPYNDMESAEEIVELSTNFNLEAGQTQVAYPCSILITSDTESEDDHIIFANGTIRSMYAFTDFENSTKYAFFEGQGFSSDFDNIEDPLAENVAVYDYFDVCAQLNLAEIANETYALSSINLRCKREIEPEP